MGLAGLSFHNNVSPANVCVSILLNFVKSNISNICLHLSILFFPLESSLLCAGTVLCILDSFKIVTHYFVSYYMSSASEQREVDIEVVSGYYTAASFLKLLPHLARIYR